MKVLMTKINDRYIPKFQIITQICENENGERHAVKKPIWKEGCAHVCQMHDAATELEHAFESISVLQCRMEGDAALFPFIQGKTLLMLMIESVHQGKDAFLTLWDNYVKSIQPKEENMCSFTNSPEFEYFFGDGKIWDGKPAYRVCSLDMLPSNIMVTDEGRWILYDYEWLMRTPVPIALVLYQAVHFCLRNRNEFSKMISVEELLAHTGIEEDEKVLQEALRHFHWTICREKPEGQTAEDVYSRYQKPIEDANFFEREYHRLLTQLREEEKERLGIIDGWNKEHLHAIEIDKERMNLKTEVEQMIMKTKEMKKVIENSETKEKALHSELEYMHQKEQQFESQAVALRKREEQLCEELNCAHQKVEHFENEVAALIKKEDKLHYMLYERNMQMNELYNQIQALQQSLEQVRGECAALKQSRSWRVTALGRRFGSWVRRKIK